MNTFDLKTMGAAPVAPRPPTRIRKSGDLLDHLVQSGIALLYGHRYGVSIEEGRARIARHYPRYDDEWTRAFCDYQARGAVAPAMTYVPGWAAQIAAETHADIIQDLMPDSAFAQLAKLGLHLPFGRAGRIVVPNFEPSAAGAFIREGEPIPVASGMTGGQILTPKKLAVIVTVSEEIDEHSIPAIEALLRARLKESTTVVLDAAMLDDITGDDRRPAGLLHHAENVASSGGVQGDIQAMGEGLDDMLDKHVRNLVLVMNPAQALAMRLHTVPLKDFPIISSPSVTPGVVIALDAADFVCAGGDMPRFEISKHAAIHMESETVRHINDGSPASPVRSLWQTATIGLRMILKVDWALRRPQGVMWMENVFWTGGGGGANPRGTPKTIGPFVAPIIGSSADVQVDDAFATQVGDTVWLPPIGYYEVEAIYPGP